MNKNIKKAGGFCLLVLLVFVLGSCSVFFNSGGDKNIPGNAGMVRIILDDYLSPDGDDPAIPRTFLPITSNANFTFRFTSAQFGERITSNIPPTITFSKELELGSWTVEITRFERTGTAPNFIDHPVARGTATFTLSAANPNPVITVTLLPIPGGTGRFTYTITRPTGAGFDGTPGNRTQASMLIRPVGGGSNFGFPLTEVPAGATGLSGTIDLPTGIYDVIVSIVAADGRGTGKSSVARIHSGLETRTTPGFFNFTADQFVESIGLAGTLNFNLVSPVIPDPAADPNVTITAHNVDTGAALGTAAPFRWINNTQEWVITGIPPQHRSVNLTVEIIGNDGITYIIRNALTVNNIPDNGREGIVVNAGLHAITWPAGNAFQATVNGLPRTHASPGEIVTISNITSDFGYRFGTVRVNNTIVPETVSSGTYRFTMPNASAALSAEFFTAELSILTINSILGIVPFTPALTPGIHVYSANVPNIVTAVQINAQSNEGSAVTVTGPLFALTTADTGNIITITVTPPAQFGGLGSRDYTLTIIRAKSSVNTLASLTVNQGTLSPAFSSTHFTYNVTVGNDVTNINIGAVASDTTATISGDIGNNLLDVGANLFIITVTAENGAQQNYTITVTRD